MDLGSLRGRAFGAIDGVRDELSALSDALLAEPEIAHQEHKSVERILAMLAEHGVGADKGLAGMATAFRAEVPGSRERAPALGLIAEYDALAGIGHGCGHNLIAASAVGAALGLKPVLDELPGRVVLFGTPAEEAATEPGVGKVLMADAGVFAGLDAVIMYHPLTSNSVAAGYNAIAGLVFEFRGRAAHSAVDPWNGRNALDGVLLTYNNINALRQHVTEDARIHGIVTEGGQAPNIVPERAVARFFVRSGKRHDLDALQKRVEDCARGAALATGTELVIRTCTPNYADLKVNGPLNARFEAHMQALGLTPDEPEMCKGSTDFGNVSYACPAACFHLSITDEPVPWHSAEVVAAAGTDKARNATLIAAKMLAATAIDVMGNEGFRRRVRDAFQQAR